MVAISALLSVGLICMPFSVELQAMYCRPNCAAMNVVGLNVAHSSFVRIGWVIVFNPLTLNIARPSTVGK